MFFPKNDRETLQRIQMGDIDFDFELWQNISREAKHFVANLLVYKPEERMSVRQVTNHPENLCTLVHRSFGKRYSSVHFGNISKLTHTNIH